MSIGANVGISAKYSTALAEEILHDLNARLRTLGLREYREHSPLYSQVFNEGRRGLATFGRAAITNMSERSVQEALVALDMPPFLLEPTRRTVFLVPRGLGEFVGTQAWWDFADASALGERVSKSTRRVGLDPMPFDEPVPWDVADAINSMTPISPGDSGALVEDVRPLWFLLHELTRCAVSQDVVTWLG